MGQVHLTQPHDVRRLLSKITNQVMNGEIEIGKANCIGQLCNIILKAMEKADLEKRIEELEKIVSQRNKRGL